MPSKVINMTFGAKGDGALETLKSIGAGADTLKKKLRELENSGVKQDAGGSVLKDLKSGLGARSGIGQLGKALKGGGAILGLSLIGKELAGATEKAKELTEQFKAGKISGGQMAEGLIESLPVVGEFWKAGQNIRDLMVSMGGASSRIGKWIGLDDIAAANELNQTVALQKIAQDYIADTLERQRTLVRGITEETRRLTEERAKAGKEGEQAKTFGIQIAGADRAAEIEKKRQAAIDDAVKRRNEAAVKLRSEEKGMSHANGVEAERAVEKAFADEKLKINQAFNSELIESNKLTGAELLKADIEHARKLEAINNESGKQIEGDQDEADAVRLKEMGDALGAQLILIQKNAREKKDAVIKALNEQSIGENAIDVAKFKEDADRKLQAIDDTAANEARLARKEQQEAAVKALQDGQLDVLRHQADAGDELARADLQRLEAAKATNEEQRKLLELLKQQLTPQQRAAALAELTALKSADHAGIVKQLADQQADALKAEEENGQTAAERRDAKKKRAALELTKQYNAEAAKAAAIIKDPNATAEDKAAATSNLQAYAKTLARQFDKQVGLDAPLKRTADLQERGLLITGVAAAARAQADPAQVTAKATTEALKLQEAANKAFADFVEWSKSQAAKNPTVVFGVSD